MKFAEFYPGQVLTLGPVSVSEQQIMAFAREFDPQRFHVGRESAARSSWGGLIASGWHTCAVAMRLVHDQVLADSESIGSPGLAYLRWPSPVRPGQPLALSVEVLEVRRSRRKPKLGILRWRWRLTHADGSDALDLEATSLFELPS